MQDEEGTLTFNDGGQATENRRSTCEECGKLYEAPILAHIISAGQMQEYYACPRCMTRVPETTEIIQKPHPPAQALKTKKPAAPEKEAIAGCIHYFGYLKKRPRDEPFPNECLTCSKMVDCLMH